jgi:hypothetical protein
MGECWKMLRGSNWADDKTILRATPFGKQQQANEEALRRICFPVGAHQLGIFLSTLFNCYQIFRG